MATSTGAYDVWLTEKLTSLSPEFDTDVFVSYIISILDTDSPAEEIIESIEEILSQVLDADQSEASCREIVDQWNQHNSEMLAAAANATKKDAGDVLSEIMEHQTLATMKETKLSEEERANKQAILAQYAQVSEGEDSDEGVPAESAAAASGHKGKGEPANSLMERNANAAMVIEAQQAQRELSRQEHERKKEKDKQDREAQRQKQQQRKDAEKKRTQKGERRR